jgi:hypothetical protein
MTTKLTSHQMRSMTPAVLKRTVGVLQKSARVDSKSRAKELRAEIKGFETKYRMTTGRMMRKVCSGELAERGDIERWVIKYNLLGMHAEA